MTTNNTLINTVKKLRLGIPTPNSSIDRQFYVDENNLNDLLEDSKNFDTKPLLSAINLCNYINKKLKICKMVEINGFQGELSTIFSNKLSPNILHVIENFESKSEKDVIDHTGSDEHNWDDVKHNFYLRSKKYPCISLEQEKSPEVFAETLEDESLDFIFLGTNNSESKITKLINMFYSKLKDGGMIAGGNWEDNETVNAVTDIVGNIDKSFEDGTWVKKIDKVKINSQRNQLKLIQNTRLGIGINEQFWANDKDIKFLTKIDSPNKVYLTGFLDFVKYHKEDCEKRNFSIKNIVEISCYQGETTSLLMKYFEDLEKISVVDKFDTVDPTWPKNIALDDIRYNFDLRTRHEKNLEVIDDVDSIDAADRFENNSIDMLYINEHDSYKKCYRLLLAWLPKVKTDGYICGWRWGSENIVQACIDHFGEPDIYFKDSSWSKIKVWDDDDDDDDDDDE